MLLHVCCGPCGCGAVPMWLNKGVKVVGFFYNPNIHPFMEYRRRVVGAQEMAEATSITLVADERYDPEEWFASVGGTADSRCERCIGLRLQRSAREANALGCNAFSTTLSISPWQDHQAIKVQGELASLEHGVEFVYEDLRAQYPESRRLSRERGIYRQKYCGCLVSEWERYRENRGATTKGFKSEAG